MWRLFSSGVLGFALWLPGTLAHGQGAGGASPSGISASFIRLFGDVSGFTAKADLRVVDESQKEWLNLPLSFALLGDRLRIEMDMTQFRQKSAPEGVEMLKQLGMAQVTSITRPDRKMVFIMFPTIKSCLEMPMDERELASLADGPVPQKKELGREKIGAYQCTKNQVVVSGPSGPILNAVTWNAAELKGFPVRIEANEQGKTSILTFRDIKMAKPDAAQFEVPSAFKRYKDQQELMTSLVQKKAAEAGAVRK